MCPSAHPLSLQSYCLSLLCRQVYTSSTQPRIEKRATSPIKNCASMVWHCLWETNFFFQSILTHPKSNMVGTRSSHPLNLLASAHGTSSNQEIVDFMKSMVESMEVLKKPNEDLNTRLTIAEAQSSWKEREREERHEQEIGGSHRERHHRERSPSTMSLITTIMTRMWKI